MKLPRRDFLHLAAGAVALPVLSRVARAQAYPARPVRIVVPVAAGGANDVTARLIGQWLSERLGQQFVIENRPGAGTNVGTEAVIRASADGYTLLIAGSNAAINATLFETLNFNFIRDTAPIASIVRVPQVMQVNPSLPVQKRSRVHRLCQSQSRQDRHGLRRQRFTGACHRGILQTDDRHRSDACPLSWRGTRGDRSARRANPGGVHRDGDVARTHQVRQAARAGGDDRHTHGGAAGHSDARASSFRVSRRASGSGSLRPRTRRQRSSRSSTPRSTLRLPIPR